MTRETLPNLDISEEALRTAALARLTDESEIALIRAMGNWPRTVEAAAEAHEPHRIAFYLYELASAFHALWTKGKDDVTLRFIVEDDTELTLARLALVRAVQTVIGAGLRVLGVQPVEELR
jgi:arginyl-tRNA synthetase